MTSQIARTFQLHKQRYQISLISTLMLLSIMAIFALKFGAINLSWQEILQKDEISRQVLFELRIPRVITTVITGVSLAVAGVLMQGLFRNPMADPSLIGMSSGASLAAMIFILLSSQQLLPLWLNNIGLSLSAFLGSLFVALLTYSLSARKGNSNIGILLLAGIAINALCGSMIGLLTYIANDYALRSITFWSMGSFANSDYISVSFIFCAILISIPILKNTAKFLDSLLIGESYAKVLGLNLAYEKNKLIFVIAILVGTCTAFVGPIGFIG
ncbi:MAG: iron ABC transporter permease, partial [Burkholderiales bacterium]|nr:iron ABC transporter permease [Burkholderiales bacterium]